MVLHSRFFSVCCATARRHLSKDGLSKLVPYPRVHSLLCPLYFSRHLLCTCWSTHGLLTQSFLQCTERGCCKVSSHGFGVFPRIQMTPCHLSKKACYNGGRVFQHCVFQISNVSFAEFHESGVLLAHSFHVLQPRNLPSTPVDGTVHHVCLQRTRFRQGCLMY